MKKLMYFTLILVLLSSICMFGAWSPVTQATESRYADAPVISSVATTEIYFTSRDIVEERDTAGGAPSYYINYGLANACGPLAGAEIVAFYDKYYSNLIPGWDSYYPATGKYRTQSTTYVQPLVYELYDLMQTNVKGDGVSEGEFKTGLQQYINNQGYSASYTSVKSGTTLDYNACKTAIDNNKVIALFTTPGDLYEIFEYSDHDLIGSFTIAGNHIMVAYGYLQIKYYNNSGLFRTDTYLKVATGQSVTSVAYYRVGTSNLEAAYVVNVS